MLEWALFFLPVLGGLVLLFFFFCFFCLEPPEQLQRLPSHRQKHT